MSFRLDGLKSTRKNPGASRGAKPEIVIGAFEDILQWPGRDEKGIRMLGNMVFEPGNRHHKSYFTPSTQVKGFETDAEEDNISITPYFKGSIPGDELEQSEFIANWLGVNCFVMTKGCNDKHWKVIGTPCTPLQIVPSHEANNDKTGFEVEFKSYAKNDVLPGFYFGEITEGGPHLIDDPASSFISEEVGFIYLIPPTNVSTQIDFDTVEIPDGKTFTFIGSGGDMPAVLLAGTTPNGGIPVILKDEIDWVALKDSTITLRSMTFNGMGYLIEESRS